MTFPEPVEKWLQALESGKYEQTTEVLTSVDDDGNKRYCCLGVACELYAQEHPDEVDVVQSSYEGIVIYKTQEAHADTELPPEVVSLLGARDAEGLIDWSKVPEDDPFKVCRTDARSLAALNDNGASFAEIAAFIRRNPTAVFMESE